jgi:hypothetical protein
VSSLGHWSALKDVHRAANLTLAGVLLAVAIAPFFFDIPELRTGPGWIRIRPPQCFVRRETGRKCPGCGLTRSIAAFYQGRWELARRYHPLGPTVVAVVLAELVLRVVPMISVSPVLLWADFCQLFAVGLVLRLALSSIGG